MGLFGKKSSSEAEEKKISWKELTSKEQLKEIKETSTSKPVAIFKHSTRCGISRMVLARFESDFDFSPEEIEVYYLDLLNFREVSTAVTHEFDVEHKSPQLLVIKDGKCVYNESHHDIEVETLSTYIK